MKEGKEITASAGREKTKDRKRMFSERYPNIRKKRIFFYNSMKENKTNQNKPVEN